MKRFHKLEPIRWQNWLQGDVKCEGPRRHRRQWAKTRRRFARAMRRYHRQHGLPYRLHVKGEVVSGYRTYAEQVRLYAAYKAGTGNLAAVPGTSAHEHAIAADIYIAGEEAGSIPEAKAAFAYWGIRFPVVGEAWHAEVKA